MNSEISSFPPSSAPEPYITSQAFREAMSRVGSAVHIVTSDGAFGRTGFTATAFSAVCDAPPIVLVSVNRNIRSNRIIYGNKTFCVNTLPGYAAAIGERFAGRGTGSSPLERFDDVSITKAHTGAPVLQEALVAMDCVLEKAVEIGTHTVFFGLVKAVFYGPENPALIYRRRGYHSL